MRQILLNAVRSHARGHIDKHVANIEVYLSNPAGLDVTHDGELLPPLGGQNEEVRRTFR